MYNKKKAARDKGRNELERVRISRTDELQDNEWNKERGLCHTTIIFGICTIENFFPGLPQSMCQKQKTKQKKKIYIYINK